MPPHGRLMLYAATKLWSLYFEVTLILGSQWL